MRKFFTPFILLIAFSYCCEQSFSQEKSDTIYYNYSWKLCEKPYASAYRLGSVKIDSLWGYAGPFKDYSIDNKLLAEGAYSEDGFRHGKFTFYDSRGKVMSTGNFDRGMMYGIWKFYYPDGREKATIYFPGNGEDFTFIDFTTGSGNKLLENGIGDFVWYLHSLDGESTNSYILKGAFNSGKRSGRWEYSFEYSGKPAFTEVYDDEGKLTGRTTQPGLKDESYKMVPMNFRSPRLDQIELFQFDARFKRGEDTTGETALANYLLYRKSPEVYLKNKNFEEAMAALVTTIQAEVRFEQRTGIDGVVEFKIGPRESPEDISVIGNFTEDEKRALVSCIGKFHNMPMPGTGNMAVEGYHKLYIFSVNLKEFLIDAFKDIGITEEIVYSAVPKDKYLAYLRAHKKQIKKRERNMYWSIPRFYSLPSKK